MQSESDRKALTGEVLGCTVSRDGKLALGTAADGTLRVWDVASQATVRILRGHGGRVYDCAFSPDGKLALSASGDGTLRLWDVASRSAERPVAND